jgi:hypothetical protein
MATRATYQIDKTTYYCHWDGYPVGAAHRFANMVAAKTVAADPERRPVDSKEERRGGMSFAFIRGNMDAEPTEDRDTHGDTEYHYQLVAAGKQGDFDVIVQEPSDDRKPGGDRGWRTVERVDLADWLNARRAEAVKQNQRIKARYPGDYKDMDPERDALESIPVIVKVKERGDYGYEPVYYATLEQARKIAAREEKLAERYKNDNPNKAVHQRKAEDWAAAVVAATVIAKVSV